MAPKNEDVIPENYTYEWSANSDVPLADFLTKYKPSMVQNDGTKPWIWVRGVDSPAGMKGMEEAVKEASTLLDEVSKRVEDIKVKQEDRRQEQERGSRADPGRGYGKTEGDI